jgi:hypothetical protein
MEWPIVGLAPVIAEHTAVFRDVFDHQCQLRHFQHDLTGLIVLPNKSLAHRACCLLDSADNTNLSRFFAEASWREEEVNRRRESLLALDESPVRTRGGPV